MKLFAAKNCNWLFLKTMVLASLLNVPFYIAATFLGESLLVNYIVNMIAGFLHMGIGVLLGLYLRKRNLQILCQEPRRRGRYAAIAFFGGLFLFPHFLLSTDLSYVYAYFLAFLFGRAHYAMMFDIFSFFLCLACVFFYKFRWLEYMQNYFQEWKTGNSCNQ